jgi:hypothetical protein
MLCASVFAGPPALQTGNLARVLLAEMDVRLPFLLRLFAAISIWMFTFAAAAYNLVRMRNLAVATA